MNLQTVAPPAGADHAAHNAATPDQRAALLDHAATAKAASIGPSGWAALAQVPEDVLRALVGTDETFMAEVEQRVVAAKAAGADLVHAARSGLRTAIDAAQAALNDPGTTPVELASLTRALSGIVQNAEMLADRKEARTDEDGERLPVFNFVFHYGVQATLIKPGTEQNDVIEAPPHQPPAEPAAT